MRLFPRVLLLALILAFSACQSPQQDKLPHHQLKLYVRYLSLDRSLKTEVTLLRMEEGKESRPVTLPGEIRVADFGLTEEETGTGTPIYVRESNLDFPGSFALEADLDGYPETDFPLEMTAPGPLDFGEARSLDEGLSFRADHTQLREGESLVVLLTNSENEVSTFTIKGPTASDSHQLPRGELSSLPAGTYQVFLVKKQESSAGRNGFALNALIEYFTPPAQLELTR